MISNLGLQNRVVQVIHGDYEYYYKLATRYSDWIDCFIAVSNSIKEKLTEMLPNRNEQILYIRFPVLEYQCKGAVIREPAIIFIGRCTKEKGYPILRSLALELKKVGMDIKWHIVGERNGLNENDMTWNSGIEVTHYGVIDRKAINTLLCRSFAFILPSLAEGMPVALVEAIVQAIKGSRE